MIDLRFGLFWSGSKLSYLRYLTFKTLRHFHPNSIIELYTTDAFKVNGYKWGNERQDFETELDGNDYFYNLYDLDVSIKTFDHFPDFPPNFQSDFFRWWYLSKNGGWYLDTDQIVLRSFHDLPLDNDLICSVYKAKSCGIYAPVGCIGANKDSEVVGFINAYIKRYFNINNYNSIGPFMFGSVIGQKKWRDKIFNSPPNYFYPIQESYLVDEIYSGRFSVTNSNFCLHWFGGHPLSQEFNKKYTESFSRNSDDSISSALRQMAI
jgi:hypothetical protein